MFPNPPRVFISYSIHDKHMANLISNALSSIGLIVIFDKYNINSGNKLTDIISENIRSSDYFIILLSQESMKSNWVQYELDQVLSKALYNRNVIIIPVIVNKFKQPTQHFLKGRKSFDLSFDFNLGLEKLVNYLKNIPYIDFNDLNINQFTNLVRDLLKKLKFSLEKNSYNYSDYGFDLKATTRNKDPFGEYIETNWAIQIKFYRSSRADISSLRQLTSYLYEKSLNFHGLLITNSQLTSAAREWLYDDERIDQKKIRVIDGVKLKELILDYPDIIKKYFHNEGVL